MKQVLSRGGRRRHLPSSVWHASLASLFKIGEATSEAGVHRPFHLSQVRRSCDGAFCLALCFHLALSTLMAPSNSRGLLPVCHSTQGLVHLVKCIHSSLLSSSLSHHHHLPSTINQSSLTTTLHLLLCLLCIALLRTSTSFQHLLSCSMRPPFFSPTPSPLWPAWPSSSTLWPSVASLVPMARVAVQR